MMLSSVSQKKSRNLEDLDDVLIVRKISAKDSDSIPIEEDFEEEIFDLDKEQHLLAEEREILFKKQLQWFQADERGRQALNAEINAIRQRREKRARVLRHRQHALDIEKERAKKIAMLPPPLPASVKLLLRENEKESEPKKPEVQMPDELQVFHMTGVESHAENKENVLSPEELEAKQRMQEECQKKAKKRFNEAIKKDRQKEEYSKVMKEIQNAELLSRREIAKSITSENKSIPCPLADKFQMVQKQADIEAASEKIFKKVDKKEHVIEDIEGYEDSYADVFSKMDSGFESKMIDCVPSFVKENYEYLLEDDSKFQGGKNFSGLDDSSDVLNEAYIETSPDYDRLSGSEKLDEAISHLDKLRTNIQTEYDQTLRPLLEAALSECDVPKKNMSDKAVEAKILKLPAKDKAVGTEMPPEIPTASPPLPISDFLNSGVMAFKRRYEWPRLGSYSKMFVPTMHQRKVHYPVPHPSEPERLTPTSWSSSSYCSLPHQHGIPASSTSSESVKCDICVAESRKEPAESNATQPPSKEATPTDRVKSDASTSSVERNKLSEYVQILATKYLAPKRATKVQSDSALLSHHSVSAALEREVVPKFREVSVTQQQLGEYPSRNVSQPETGVTDGKSIDSAEMSAAEQDIQETMEEVTGERRNLDTAERLDKVSKYSEETPVHPVQQTLDWRMPRFTLDSGSPVENAEDRSQQAAPSLPVQCPAGARPYIYHELSTIQEVDSALTAESLHFSRSKLSNASAASNENGTAADRSLLESSRDRFKVASLLDPPDADVTELAKNIQFVGETQRGIVHPLVSSDTQDSANILLKKDSSMPSSFLSTLSASNDLARSASKPSRKDHRFLPHFSDGSDIRQMDSSSGLSGVSLTPGLFSSHLTSPVTLTGLSTPSMKSTGNTGPLTPGLLSSHPSTPNTLTGLSTPSIKSSGNAGSLESGYTNSPVFTTYQSSLFATDRKSDASTSASSPAFSSIHFTPTMVDSGSGGQEHFKSGSFINSGKSDGCDSNKSQSTSPHFDISGPSSVRGGGNAKMPPLTSQSNLSGPSHGSADAEFQPLTPRYDLSGPSIGSAGARFQPMTPQPDISSPSIGSVGAKFLPMTPQWDVSGLSSLSEGAKLLSNYGKHHVVHGKHSVQHRSQTTSSSSSESFAPLTAHSNISSPSEVNPDFHGHSKSAENFRALTPVSTISTPSLHNYKSDVGPKNAPSGSSNFYPMKLRIDISSDSASSKASPSSSANNAPQLNYRISVKAPVPDDVQWEESVAKSEQTKASNAPRVQLSDGLHVAEKISSTPEAKLRAKVCSSGYFTPSVGVAEFHRSERKQEVLAARETDEESSEAGLRPDAKQIPFSSAAVTEFGSKERTTVSTKDAQNAKRDLEEKFKVSGHSKNLWGAAEKRAFNKPLGHLQLISSASSSNENLSEISGSKVVLQSTPIKSAEELALEPGILEEPDLTLMTTEYSCRANTTVKPLEASKAGKDRTLEECRTPTNQSSPCTETAATPSLLSFMQHEISCEDAGDEVSIKIMKLTPVASESRADSRGKEVPHFSRFKQRTKRLWNNLEEVKKKNSEEERRKLMAANRIKAKEYAKKLTPRRK